MKRIVTILFLVFYLMISFGLTINLHYCGGQLESVHFFGNMKTCCCGVEEMNNSCCENQTIHFQLNKEQRIGQDIRIQLVSSIDLLVQDLFSEFVLCYKSEKNNSIIQFDLPPPKKQPTWLINCSLTYYA